ncbi:hypothetical protein AB7M63_003628 [Bradyrhizobium japonicum]
MADPASTHALYDLAKDFQPTFAAIIALAAATIAYRGVLARISYDKAVAEAARHTARLSLCTRLKLRARPMGVQARSLSEWLDNEQARLSIAEVEEQMQVWPHPPGEFEEAWQHLDALPVDAIDALDALRDQQSRMAYVLASPAGEKEDWRRLHVRTISSVAKQVALHADALVTALEVEIAAMRKAADRIR